MWPVDAEDGAQMTSVAGIKFVQDGLWSSPAATIVQHGRYTHSVVHMKSFLEWYSRPSHPY